MSTYAIVLFLHVLSATTLLGGGMVAATLFRVGARRARTYDGLRTVLAVGSPLRVINPAVALVLLASGVYLASLLHWWSLGWVRIAVALWIVNLVVAARVVGPHVGRLAREIVGLEGPVSGAADRIRWSTRWTIGSSVMTTNDAAVLMLMLLKPSFALALEILAVAHAVHLGALALDAAWRGRSARQRMALQH